MRVRIFPDWLDPEASAFIRVSPQFFVALVKAIREDDLIVSFHFPRKYLSGLESEELDDIQSEGGLSGLVSELLD